MNSAQRAAIRAVEARSRAGRTSALRTITNALDHVVTERELQELQAVAISRGRVTLNFHPDRICCDGKSVAEGLLRAGRYRNQFETGHSNGSRSAVTGGLRDRWERLLFDGAYNGKDVFPHDRPVYGTFDLLHNPYGGWPRFGSSYFVLADHILERTTFCVGDSNSRPIYTGVSSDFSSILAGLIARSSAVDLDGRQTGLVLLEDLTGREPERHRSVRLLDGVVEAQIHGGVSLMTDVIALVLDPSFRGTEVNTLLCVAGEQHGFPIQWHCGSELPADRVPSSSSTPEIPFLARQLARPNGLLDASAIGRLTTEVPLDPPTESGDPQSSPLEKLKHLWHAVFTMGTDMVKSQ